MVKTACLLMVRSTAFQWWRHPCRSTVAFSARTYARSTSHLQRIDHTKSDEESLYQSSIKLPRLFVGEEEGFRTLPLKSDVSLKKTLHSVLKGQGREPQGGVGPVLLSNDQAHYLSTVLRLGKTKGPLRPARVRLFNGKEEWLADVSLSFESTRRRTRATSATAEFVTRLRRQSHASQEELAISCWIFAAAPKKKDRVRWLVEKCTELAVDGFVFLRTEYSEQPESRFSKLPTYALEAAEQCERLQVPKFLAFLKSESRENAKAALTDMQALLDEWKRDSDKLPVLICRERSETSSNVLDALQALCFEEPKYAGPIAFVIGPEGGWSNTEEELFDVLEDEFQPLFQSVRLGSTILRAETAAVTAAAASSLTFDQKQ